MSNERDDGGATVIFRERHEIDADELRESMGRLRPADRELIHHIVSDGGDLNKTTHILVHIYLASLDDAEATAEALVPAFSRVRILDPEDEERLWIVIGEAYACLVPPNIRAMSDFCTAIADQHHGEYDGWEAKVIKTNASMWYARFMRVQRFIQWLTQKPQPADPNGTTFYKTRT